MVMLSTRLEKPVIVKAITSFAHPGSTPLLKKLVPPSAHAARMRSTVSLSAAGG